MIQNERDKGITMRKYYGEYMFRHRSQMKSHRDSVFCMDNYKTLHNNIVCDADLKGHLKSQKMTKANNMPFLAKWINFKQYWICYKVQNCILTLKRIRKIRSNSTPMNTEGIEISYLYYLYCNQTITFLVMNWYIKQKKDDSIGDMMSIN